MIWPLGPAPALLVVAVTVMASLRLARDARNLQALTDGAAQTGNPAVISATERRVRRSWQRHCVYTLPTLWVGMSLMVTQAVACLAVVLPH